MITLKTSNGTGIKERGGGLHVAGDYFFGLLFHLGLFEPSNYIALRPLQLANSTARVCGQY